MAHNTYGLANENFWIALSNDPVLNKSNYCEMIVNYHFKSKFDIDVEKPKLKLSHGQSG